MKRNLSTLMIIVLLVAASALSAQPARAGQYFTKVTHPNLAGDSCNKHGFSANLHWQYNLPLNSQWYVDIQITLNSDIIAVIHDIPDFFFGKTGSGEFDNTFSPTFSHTTQPQYFYVFLMKSKFSDGSDSSVYITFVCNSKGVLAVEIDQSSAADLDGLPGPAVPEGFVLKTITCDVAVFNTPGGYPVGDNRLRAGQTWFVNPTPTKDDKGKSWTEVFPSGYSNGFVPTSCVGGQ